MPMNDYNLSNNRYYNTIDVPREETASLLAKVLGITSLGFFITSIGVATAPVWGTFVGFIIVHLALVILADPINELKSMITGWWDVPEDRR